MSATVELTRLEAIIDTAGVGERIETLLPAGVRPRQLSVRTLLVGMLLVAVDGRPMHLRRVHQALLALPHADQRRLGVLAPWRYGWHRLTYRQVEYTFTRVVRALSKPIPDGAPSQLLADALDRLLEASVQELGVPSCSSYAIDWTDLEASARPPRPAAIPRPPGGTAPAPTPPRTSCSTATTSKPSPASQTSTAPKCPSSCAGSTSPAASMTRPRRSSPSCSA